MNRTLARFRAATKNIRTSTTIALWSSFVLSAGLLCASFVVPPTGQIDPSVLKAASLVFAFAGLFFLREAVMEGLGVKLTHGDTTIVIHDLDGKDGEAATQERTTIMGEYLLPDHDGDADTGSAE